MEIKYLEVLVMPNKEIICKGKTVGWADEFEEHLFTGKEISELKIKS